MSFKRIFKLKRELNTFVKTGTHTLLIPPESVSQIIEEDLEKIYHRKNLALKVFYKAPYPKEMEMYEVTWSYIAGENLVEGSKIQNIYALEGLAPRVYDLIWLENKDWKYAAQVIEYVAEKCPFKDNIEAEKAIKRIKSFAEEKRISTGDVWYYNFLGNKFVDFQDFTFDTATIYSESDGTQNGKLKTTRLSFKAELCSRVNKGLSFGGEKEFPYQSVETLNLPGIRKNLLRNKVLKIDPDELPENFTILDVGCNGGYFMRRAFDAGAGYGVGVDIDRVITASAELNAYLGYFNMDFMTKAPEQDFDVVLFLSMSDYLPLEEAANHCKKVMFFEGHACKQYSQEHCVDLLKPYFNKVIVLGVSHEGDDLVDRVILKGVK